MRIVIQKNLFEHIDIKTLNYDNIVANSRFFNNDINLVPKTALTVGVGTILNSKEVLIIITGYNKCRALQKVVEEGVNYMWTVSALQMHPKLFKLGDCGLARDINYRPGGSSFKFLLSKH